MGGQNYQTKFFASSDRNESQFLKKLGMQVFQIRKTVFVELDFMNQSETEHLL